MLFNLLVIIGMETLAISCFCAGVLIGRYTKKEKITKTSPIVLPDDVLDPVSPQDQALIKKLEEANKYGQAKED